MECGIKDCNIGNTLEDLFARLNATKIRRHVQGAKFYELLQCCHYRLGNFSGILEDFVARRAILRFYSEQGGILSEGEDVKEIADKAREGDGKALEAFRSAGRHYATGARDVIERLEIRHLLFAGQIAKSFDLMEKEIRDGLGKDLKVSVVDDIQGTVLAGIASL